MDMSKREWLILVSFAIIIALTVKYSVEWKLQQPVCDHTFGEWFVETDAFQSRSLRLCPKCGKLQQ